MVAMKKSPWQERKTIKVVGDTANYFQGESVEVVISRKREKNAHTSITAWGEDDIGMVLYEADFDKARNYYKQVESGITEKQLKALGFRQD